MNESICKLSNELKQISKKESLNAIEKLILIEAARNLIGLSFFKEHILRGERNIMNVKLLTPTAMLPTRGSTFSAGYDLYADITEEILIYANETLKVGTGIAIEIPENLFGGIFARSGLATREGLRPANCVGVIDSDYRGEVVVAIHNDSSENRIIYPHERIAQLVIMPYVSESLEIVENLSDTVRGSGGFGSSGTL